MRRRREITASMSAPRLADCQDERDRGAQGGVIVGSVDELVDKLKEAGVM